MADYNVSRKINDGQSKDRRIEPPPFPWPSDDVHASFRRWEERQMAKKLRAARRSYALTYVLENFGIFVASFFVTLASQYRGRSRHDGGKIVRPPGHATQSILRFIYTKKAFDAVFSQAIIDLREEHNEALQDNLHWRARWIYIRGIAGIVMTVILHAATASGKAAAKLWKIG